MRPDPAATSRPRPLRGISLSSSATHDGTERGRSRCSAQRRSQRLRSSSDIGRGRSYGTSAPSIRAARGRVTRARPWPARARSWCGRSSCSPCSLRRPRRWSRVAARIRRRVASPARVRAGLRPDGHARRGLGLERLHRRRPLPGLRAPRARPGGAAARDRRGCRRVPSRARARARPRGLGRRSALRARGGRVGARDHGGVRARARGRRGRRLEGDRAHLELVL